MVIHLKVVQGTFSKTGSGGLSPLKFSTDHQGVEVSCEAFVELQVCSRSCPNSEEQKVSFGKEERWAAMPLQSGAV